MGKRTVQWSRNPSKEMRIFLEEANVARFQTRAAFVLFWLTFLNGYLMFGHGLKRRSNGVILISDPGAPRRGEARG